MKERWYRYSTHQYLHTYLHTYNKTQTPKNPSLFNAPIMTEDVLVSVPSVLVWCCWVGGVTWTVPGSVKRESHLAPLSSLPLPASRCSSPALCPHFLVARRQVSTLHVLIGPFFQSPNYLGCTYLYLSLFYIVLSIDAARGRRYCTLP